MSDKSHGDPASRNMVKNPLLSTAVTGLSIEDLTHNAVLLPIPVSQELNTVQGHQYFGTEARTLGHPENATQNLPSGDANPNVIFSKPTLNLNPSQQQIKNEKYYENVSLSQSKALQKSDDDFDVNEYFARLQGTRYVSAPLNVIKDDASANLQAEEYLEEINLNEPEKLGDDVQSLTADIAQNFSQLPTVLPQVASAVFSSFSNILSMKSKESTPDVVRYQEVQRTSNVGVPLEVNEMPKEAPPLMKPPTFGTGNYRITTKKKAYAHIPGLNSNETQAIPSYNPTIQTNVPSFFTPDSLTANQHQTVAPTTADVVNANVFDNTSNAFNIFNPTSTVPQNVTDPTKPCSNQATMEVSYNKKIQEPVHNMSHDLNMSITQPQIPIIPPPPMFSNQERRDGQAAVEKSVLPPSVARRISANQPILKTNVPQAANISKIFVPAPDEIAANPLPTNSFAASSVPQSSSEITFGVPNDSSYNQTSLISNLSVSSNAAVPPSSFPGYSATVFTPAPPQSIIPPASIPTASLPPQSILPPATPINPQALPTSIPMSSSVPYSPSHPPIHEVQPSTASFFNPVSQGSVNTIENITQIPQVSNPTDNVPEPPKMSGNQNFRMTKKRPQYYAGPIEGVGAISNNVKPIINPVNVGAYQGALFTPEQHNTTETTIAQSFDNTAATVPFDISQPVNAPVYPEYQPQQYGTYNTTFDLSRPADNYEPPKEESKGFGIIGSLKSKLSSIDINKIQDSVTMLFDPAYNDVKSNEQNNTYGGQSYGQNYSPAQTYSNNQSASFEIFVSTPNVQPYAGYQDPVHPVQDNPYKAQHQNDVYQDPMTGQAYPAFSYYSSVPTGSNQAYTVAAGNTIVAPSISISDQVSAQIYNPYYNDSSGNMFSVMQVEVNSQELVNETVVDTPKDHQSSEKPVADVANEANVEVQSINVPEQRQQVHSSESMENIPFSSPDKEISNSTQAFERSGEVVLNNVREDSEMESKTNVGQKLENYGALKDEYLSKFKDDIPTLANSSQYDRNIVVKPLEVKTNVDSKQTSDLFTSSFSNEAGESLLQVTDLSSPVLKDRQDSDNISEFNICETCREVNRPEDDERGEDVTSQMIENITSRIQLMNPVEAPLPEPADGNENPEFDLNQYAEISHVTEETIEALQKQAAAELLDDIDDNKTGFSYGWTTDTKPVQETDHDYSFQLNPNKIDFFGSSSLFSDGFSNNAPECVSDIGEIKPSAVFQEDLCISPKIPSTPPTEIVKEVEPGALDVNSIEQDAKEDFVYEEFVIEPADAEENSSNVTVGERNDTFTNRVERFKMKDVDQDDDDVFDMQALQNQVFDLTASPAITIASYFDTGNYAVERNYRNTLTSPVNSRVIAPAFDVDRSNDEDGQIRIPPGFEEMFKNYSGSHDIILPDKEVPKVPETDTQTSVSSSVTFSSANLDTSTVSTTLSFPAITTVFSSIEQNVTEFDKQDYINPEIKHELPTQPLATEMVKLPDFASAFGAMKYTDETKGDKEVQSTPVVPTEKVKESQPVPGSLVNPVNFFEISTKKDDFKVNPAAPVGQIKETSSVTALPDPMNFFSETSKKTETKTEDVGFNRLASYFASPPKADHSKSFFELSQSQNHYRHETMPNTSQINNPSIRNIPQDRYDEGFKLIKELASPNNIEPSKDQVVKTVNYFSVEYDTFKTKVVNESNCNYAKLSGDGDLKMKLDSQFETDISDKSFEEIVNNCQNCCNIGRVNLNKCRFKLRQCIDNYNSNKEMSNDNKLDSAGTDNQRSVTVNFDNFPLHNDGQDDTLLAENHRTSAEYVPVKHHWFYRVDFDGKSLWRGFSVLDSKNLEDAFNSPTLNENTLVQTDGGRFDVNIVGRLRFAVYWSEKPTNVRRCSWFYKGTTDARYVPYTEAVAEKLEEEYRRGMSSGEWHRRLVLPTSELVVMHGPLVMVHFLQPDHDPAFTHTPLFAFGKRVYRNPPKINMCKDQHQKIDHLLLITHGAGEYRSKHDKDQSTSRPRIVHRGCEEPEIEDPEPSSIDHLLLMCHGVGSACDLKMRPIEQVVDDFRATSSQLTQSHYKNSFENGVVGRVEVLPVSWHAELHDGENGVDARLQRVTLNSIPRLRAFTNDTVLDVLLYTSPVFCQTIMDTVCSELNRIYNLFLQRNPGFSGTVSLAGHSLGSLILYDLLCHQTTEATDSDKKCMVGIAGTGQPAIRYPRLGFRPTALYALGSPIAIFECIRGVQLLGEKFSLPTCRNFFNIFHPYDPIAYRIEPLINPQLKAVKPFLIPHHKGRKRMHLELKETMARVGADIKQKVIESIKATWSSVWKTQPPPSDTQLEKVVEEELEKGNLEEEKEEQEQLQPSPDMLGALNGGRRVDYVLQEAPIEMINEYLFAMRSHVCYWESEDTMLLILREIYSSLGVQPDASLPQSNLSVPRTRTTVEAYAANITDPIASSPSTSRASPSELK